MYSSLNFAARMQNAVIRIYSERVGTRRDTYTVCTSTAAIEKCAAHLWRESIRYARLHKPELLIILCCCKYHLDGCVLGTNHALGRLGLTQVSMGCVTSQQQDSSTRTCVCMSVGGGRDDVAALMDGPAASKMHAWFMPFTTSSLSA